MKKVIAILCAMILLVGCSYEPPNKVELLEQDNLSFTKRIEDAVNGYEVNAGKYSSSFELRSKDFIDEVNKKASEKGYKPLVKFKSDKDRISYTHDDESWYIFTKSKEETNLNIDGEGCVEEIELTLYSDSIEQSKMNGDYLYILMGLFNPGMEQIISDELFIFNQPEGELPSIRKLVCGNVVYSYLDSESGSSEFIIRPIHVPIVEEKIPAAIAPGDAEYKSKEQKSKIADSSAYDNKEVVEEINGISYVEMSDTDMSAISDAIIVYTTIEPSIADAKINYWIEKVDSTNNIILAIQKSKDSLPTDFDFQMVEAISGALSVKKTTTDYSQIVANFMDPDGTIYHTETVNKAE